MHSLRMKLNKIKGTTYCNFNVYKYYNSGEAWRGRRSPAEHSEVMVISRHRHHRHGRCRKNCPMSKSSNHEATLSCLGVEEEAFEGYGLKELLYALHLQLVGKRYLIVFDDARDIDGHESWYNRQLNLPLSHAYDETWDSLASGLPKGYGGAVIVTSRDEKLMGKMVGKENIRHILPLSESDENCWSIFKEAAGENPNEEDDMKKEIQLKCAGIPLVAKMMGQIKKSQTLSNSEKQAASNETKQA
ncbi:hypothetical protein CJ030_MR1G028905 [Morella rubra]|uniref:NB-ARC domain-containing protein n=1 Tax=Morella rubra TaxID=262757 RepID=A0A6A1WVJ6_9ROSI|nr:hypothetical protein CJ030_MR1G028905 [Morella rubra]